MIHSINQFARKRFLSEQTFISNLCKNKFIQTKMSHSHDDNNDDGGELLISKSFKSIKQLENLNNFADSDQWGDTRFSKEDRKTLQKVCGTNWSKLNQETLQQIFKRSDYKPTDDIVFVVEEKLDGSNVRFGFNMETKTGHFRSRNKVLKNQKDYKIFFDSKKRLDFHLPYIEKVIHQAIKNELIPETAEMVYLTCEMVGGKTGAKDRRYWKDKDTPLMLIPIDLSFDLQGVSKCVPYTTNWWDVDIEGFKLARKAPEPLLVTSNLEEALLAIARHKNTVSKLCDLIEPSERGNTTMEGCVLRVIKQDDANEMYKYVYSGGLAMTKFKNEISNNLKNIITHFGLNFDEEFVAQEALNELAEEIKTNPILKAMAKEQATKIKLENQCC